jgi:hypothetical protein
MLETEYPRLLMIQWHTMEEAHAGNGISKTPNENILLEI